MKVTKLKEHVLLKSAVAINIEYIAKCNPNDPKKFPLTTKREFYALETFQLICNVTSCIDQLYFAIDLLSGYRTANAPKKMNRHDYIVFSIENYYLRSTSVFDRCLRLANIIYQFGLPEKQCNYDSIIKNAYVKKTSVAESLKQLDKFTGPFRYHRNTIAHQKIYSEEDLKSFEAYYHLLDIDNDNDSPVYNKDFLKHLSKKEADNFVSDKKQEFREHLVKLEDIVEKCFSALHNVFKAHLTNIS